MPFHETFRRQVGVFEDQLVNNFPVQFACYYVGGGASAEYYLTVITCDPGSQLTVLLSS